MGTGIIKHFIYIRVYLASYPSECGTPPYKQPLITHWRRYAFSECFLVVDILSTSCVCAPVLFGKYTFSLKSGKNLNAWCKFKCWGKLVLARVSDILAMCTNIGIVCELRGYKRVVISLENGGGDRITFYTIIMIN